MKNRFVGTKACFDVFGYVGLAVSSVLPFVVKTKCAWMDRGTQNTAIASALLVQLVLQGVCFLRVPILSNKWNAVALSFSAVVVAIFACGSSWIMHHLSLHY